jgi:hypothetical protein
MSGGNVRKIVLSKCYSSKHTHKNAKHVSCALRLKIFIDVGRHQVLKHSFQSVYDIHNPPVVQ